MLPGPELRGKIFSVSPECRRWFRFFIDSRILEELSCWPKGAMENLISRYMAYI